MYSERADDRLGRADARVGTPGPSGPQPNEEGDDDGHLRTKMGKMARMVHHYEWSGFSRAGACWGVVHGVWAYQQGSAIFAVKVKGTA